MSLEFYEAATCGDTDKVRRMLAASPSLVHSTIQWQFVALHGVAGEECIEMAELLLDSGADPNARNDEGIAPLHLAAYPEMVELLVRRGADIDARTRDGRTPLLVHAAEAERCDVMAALLELGADPKAVDDRGSSAMDIAMSREEDDKMDLLAAFVTAHC